jgi:site-specific DNA-methyltransferase (adenine-specific)
LWVGLALRAGKRDKGRGKREEKTMKPYYEEAGITIYHGDCREILPQLGRFDLLLTDPPYGIGFVHSGKGGCLAKSTVFGGVSVIGDDVPFEPAHLLDVADKVVMWGANHYADKLPASSSWLIWDKREGMCENDQADCELAWSNIGGPARLLRHYWNGMLKASEKGVPRVHPTQKPVSLMKWCISRVQIAACSLVDPYAGSGTSLVAAKDLGILATGIELEEKYCEIAANRLRQSVLNFEEAF